MDGWVDALSGLGSTTPTKGQSIQYVLPDPPSDQTLADLYEGDWLARAIVETLPEQALMRGVMLPDLDDPDPVLARFQEVNTIRVQEGAYEKAQYLGRLFGGALLLIGYSTGPGLEKPAPETGEVAFLDVIHRHQVTVNANDRYSDPQNPLFGLPEFYTVTQGPFHGRRIHESRFIRTSGLTKAQKSGEVDIEPEWGLSVLQPVLTALSRYGLSWQAISHLLQEASIGVLKIAGLIEMLGSEDQSTIETRAEVLNTTKSIARTMFLDADFNEDFKRVPVSFADLPQLMAQITSDITGASRTPAMLLFGQTPTGLNSTGEGDLRAFYDRVASKQRSEYAPQLSRLFSILEQSETKVEFPPLWAPTAAEAADIRVKNLTGDQILYNMEAIEGPEIALARANNQDPEDYVETSVLEERLKDATEDPPEPQIPPGNPGFPNPGNLPEGAETLGEGDPGDAEGGGDPSNGFEPPPSPER